MFHVKHSDLYLCFSSDAEHSNQPHFKSSLPKPQRYNLEYS